MIALPARRAPRRCEDSASACALTRRPATAGSTRRTYEGSGDTAFGASRGGAGRGTARAGSESIASGAARTIAARRTVRRRRVIGSPGSAIDVLPLIPGAEFARLERPPPCFVLAVPPHGALQRGGEGVTRRPAELSDLGGIHRVTAGVARAVGHPADERVGLARQSQDFAGQNDVFHLVAAADVVDLAVATPTQDEIDGGAVVDDIEPVSHVAPVSIERQRLVVEGVGDEQRDDFLRILVRP